MTDVENNIDSMASPPPPMDGYHDDNYYGGVCDYATAFRSAINDVYNSVPGLTLYDVAGRHGWGLSLRKHDQPQASKQAISIVVSCLSVCHVETCRISRVNREDR